MSGATREVLDTLTAVAAARSTPEGAAWLRAQLGAVGARFHAGFASAGRRLGTAPIELAGAARLLAVGLLVPERFGVDACGRGALLLAAMPALAADAQVELARDLVRRGDLRERRAVLRVLAVLPEPARFVDLAIEASRSRAAGVVAAIACDNGYPARHFPDPAFADLVLAALAVGAPLARIDGLAGRITDELSRRVEAEVRARRAAGRPVPDDVALALRRR